MKENNDKETKSNISINSPKNLKSSSTSSPETKIIPKLRNKWVNGNLIAPLIILATLGVGVGVAIWISLNKVVRKQALKNDQPLLEIQKQSKIIQTITFKDIEENTLLDPIFSSDLEKNLLAEAIKFLYQKELKASKDFVTLYNQAFSQLENFEELKPLKELREIEKQSKNTIEDLKNTFQQSYGIHNWPEAFANELAKEEFGKSKSEEEAIAHLNTTAMKKAAFGPWIVSFSNFFNLANKNGIILEKDLLLDEDGELKSIKKAGENFSLNFLAHAKISSQIKEELSANQKVVALLSNSFAISKKDVFEKIKDFLLIKGYKIFWKLLLPFKINRLHNRITFSITRDNLKKLLQILPFAYVNESGKEVSFQTKTVFESIFEVPGIKEILDSQKLQSSNSKHLQTILIDPLLLQSQISQLLDSPSQAQESESTNQEKLKTLYTKTLFEVFEDDLEIAPVFLSSIFQKKTLKNSTMKSVVEALRQELFPQLQFPSSEELISRPQIQFLNKEMSKLIDTTLEVEEIFNKVMHKFFVKTQLGGEKISTVFELFDKKLLFGEKDVFIINDLDNGQYENFLNALLQRIANNQQNPLDFNRVFEDFEDENNIMVDTLKNPSFVKYLLEQSNPLKENKNFTMEELNMILKNQKNKLITKREEQILKTFDTFKKEIEKQASSNTNADLTFVDRQLFFSVDLNSKNKNKKPYFESFSKLFREEFGS